MKILSSKTIRIVDAKTIKYNKISSLELMEAAAVAFFDRFVQKHTNQEKTIAIFCGMGNNGGDGLVLARLLHYAGYKVIVFIVKVRNISSNDYALNLEKVKRTGVTISNITSAEEIPDLSDIKIVIDAIFGTGLSRELSGLAKKVIISINQERKHVVSVDVPSGLFLNKQTILAISANETITFQIPKLALFLPDNDKFVGNLTSVDIGLSTKAISEAKTDKYLITSQNLASILKPLNKFTHKGTQGHSLIIGGSLGKIGAISLASKAALKTGCGLVTAFIPQCGTDALQCYFPEAMVIEDKNRFFISSISYNIHPDAIAIGMGMGQNEETKQALYHFLLQSPKTLVIDADALNILAENSDWLSLLQPNTILTPHPAELARLIGNWKNDFEKIESARAFAQKYTIIIVIKGAHTLIIDSNNLYVNSSGTPALATAASGDILSGMIAGLLAQSYEPIIAAQLGVYIHGMTANITSDKINPRAFIASDIIDNIGKVYDIMDDYKEK
ncbi:MAG TPA: NAD(P)H-hydrate dehydratase [Dysgonamonadaceae bacterium]|nr:NAD(P)H-hydrate dehydratase [Dysgonamonadaceae bacterium]